MVCVGQGDYFQVLGTPEDIARELKIGTPDLDDHFVDWYSRQDKSTRVKMLSRLYCQCPAVFVSFARPLFSKPVKEQPE